MSGGAYGHVASSKQGRGTWRDRSKPRTAPRNWVRGFVYFTCAAALPAVDAGKVRKLEAEVANLVQGVAEGIRSPSLIARLEGAEAELEQLKAAAQVIDLKTLTAALDRAIEHYMEWVADLGKAPIDVPRGRAIIERIAPRIPVRPGADGVPIAEVSLQEAVPLALAAGSDIGGIPRPRYHF